MNAGYLQATGRRTGGDEEEGRREGKKAKFAMTAAGRLVAVPRVSNHDRV